METRRMQKYRLMENHCQPKFPYQAKVSFKNEEKTETFSDRRKSEVSLPPKDPYYMDSKQCLNLKQK